jgi:hypothetical protein
LGLLRPDLALRALVELASDLDRIPGQHQLRRFEECLVLRGSPGTRYHTLVARSWGSMEATPCPRTGHDVNAYERGHHGDGEVGS